MNLSKIKYIIFILIAFGSCKNSEVTTKGYQIVRIKNPPKNKPYLYENKFKLIDDKNSLTKTESKAIENRLKSQLDDSSKVNKVDNLLFFGRIKNPIAYDTGYSAISAKTMQASMYHLGYYNAKATYDTTVNKRRVTVTYTVTAGIPTLIDTVSYRLRIPELQAIAFNSKKESLLTKYNPSTNKQNPITKLAVLSEISRLVDSFRNNGYYKFTAAELRVRGDSSVEALTNTSDDPFEQLRLLEEAQKKRDSPTLKLAIVLNKPDDSTKLNKYYVNKIYVLTDFKAKDTLSDTVKIAQFESKGLIERYHRPLFKTSLLTRNITLKTGDVYRYQEYLNTLNNLTRLGVWQAVNIRLIENFDYPDKVDIIIELIPAKKYSYVSSIDGSYLTNINASNALGANLFGFSLNLSLINKNFAREAIRMSHSFKSGIEINNKSNTTNSNLINSLEFSYTNSTVIPKIAIFQNKFKKIGYTKGESFINTSVSYNNRFNLFSLQSVNLNLGISAINKKNNRLTIRPFAEYSNLFNESQAFKDTLDKNPFLRYSYNTSLLLGISGSFMKTIQHARHPKSLSKISTLRINFEESGIGFNALIPNSERLKKYLKLDVEFKNTVTFKNNTALASRVFVGVGKPILGDPSLPFFKQYLGGGSNSMRGWPVRGIGRGSQKLADRNSNIFNDRTGDIQFEINYELRHDIIKIYEDLIILRGAAFIDIGNVWNYNDIKVNNISDGSKFEPKNFARELGMSAGYGFRIDFASVILRTDFSFRFKRPETSNVNFGWKYPDIGFNDAFKKIFKGGTENKDWRYNNFNFTLGINYPF
jgi:outer membrane protein insertion porin family